MTTKKFDRSYLEDDLFLPASAIVDNITGHSRWSVHHEIVFEDEGRFWQTTYSEGATEMQDEAPWEYDETVEATEVALQDVVVQKWLPAR